jgi:disulfide oxidoreductase YuzD
MVTSMQPANIPNTSNKFTSLQLELLRIFAHNPDEQELKDIKRILGQYYLNKLCVMADAIATEKNWTNEDVENILNDPNQ